MQFQFTAEHHGLARQQSARVHAAGVNPAKEISQKLEPIQLGIAGLQVLIFVGMELYAWLGGDTAACPISTTWLKVWTVDGWIGRWKERSMWIHGWIDHLGCVGRRDRVDRLLFALRFHHVEAVHDADADHQGTCPDGG